MAKDYFEIRTGLKQPWLKALARAVAVHDGKVGVDGIGHGSAGIRLALRNRGLIDEDNLITEKGKEALARARRLGW